MVDLHEIANKRLSETDLTVQDLITLVEQFVTERLKGGQQSSISVSPENWWRSMVDEIIVPSENTPSPTTLLQQERDQWYKPS
jgi:hypothetical protein